MNTIGAIVLAAGGSVRFGMAKQLLRFRGSSLVRHAANVALAAGCDPVVVVLGANADDCAAELHDVPVEIAINLAWRSGMAGSLRTGLETLRRSTPDAALICLCDQPQVSAEVLRVITATFRETKARIVASEYAGTLGAPALFHASLFGELRRLSGDEGARLLFARFPSEVVSIPNSAAALDLDTPADYARFLLATSDNQVAALAR